MVKLHLSLGVEVTMTKIQKITIQSIEKSFDNTGLLLIGVVPLQGDDRGFKAFEQWLSNKMHAGMSFLERYKEIRQDPKKLGEGLVSSILFSMPYYQGDKLRSPVKPRVAQYARFTDYHKFMKKKAGGALDALKNLNHDIELQGRVTIDSAPILERSLFSSSGQGFIGKNTCFIHVEHGSYLLLGELHLNCAVEYSVKEKVDSQTRTDRGGCGTCRRCQVNCPTGALSKDYILDATKCLSYWTIEHRGPVPEEFWPHFQKFWYGCDICQLVCPYNRVSVNVSSNLPLKGVEDLDLFDVAVMDQSQYESMFGGTPMTRAKKNGLKRNALIALWASKDSRLNQAVERIEQSNESDEMLLETILKIRNKTDE